MWAGVPFIRTRQINPRTEPQLSQRRQCSEFARNGSRQLIIICTNRMARKCEQAWHDYKQDTPIHVPRSSRVNDASRPSSLRMELESWLFPVQIGKKMWASVPFIRTRQTNARTEIQCIQWSRLSEFARNCPVELIRIWWNSGKEMWASVTLMPRKDKPIHVQRYSSVNDVSAPSTLGIDPVSWL
jgi:hypothetical protein